MLRVFIIVLLAVAIGDISFRKPYFGTALDISYLTSLHIYHFDGVGSVLVILFIHFPHAAISEQEGLGFWVNYRFWFSCHKCILADGVGLEPTMRCDRSRFKAWRLYHSSTRQFLMLCFQVPYALGRWIYILCPWVLYNLYITVCWVAHLLLLVFSALVKRYSYFGWVNGIRTRITSFTAKEFCRLTYDPHKGVRVLFASGKMTNRLAFLSLTQAHCFADIMRRVPFLCLSKIYCAVQV